MHWSRWFKNFEYYDIWTRKSISTSASWNGKITKCTEPSISFLLSSYWLCDIFIYKHHKFFAFILDKYQEMAEFTELLFEDMPSTQKKLLSYLTAVFQHTEEMIIIFVRNIDELKDVTTYDIDKILNWDFVSYKSGKHTYTIDSQVREAMYSELGEELLALRETVYHHIEENFETLTKDMNISSYHHFLQHFIRLGLYLPSKKQESLEQFKQYLLAAKIFNNTETERIVRLYLKEAWILPTEVWLKEIEESE